MPRSSSRVGNQDTAGRSFAEAADYYLLHKGKNRGDTFKRPLNEPAGICLKPLRTSLWLIIVDPMPSHSEIFY